MAHYFMHLRNGTDDLLDPDGRAFLNLATLHDAVLFTARDLMMGDVQNGVLDLRYRIDAEDERGAIVHTLAFTDALGIIPDGDPARFVRAA